MNDPTASPPAAPHHGEHGLRLKLIGCFCAIFTSVLILVTLTRLLGVPFTSYHGRISEEKKEAHQELDTLADVHKARLLDWIEARKGDALLVSLAGQLSSKLWQLKLHLDRLRKIGPQGADPWEQLKSSREYRDVADILPTILHSFGQYRHIDFADLSSGEIFSSSDPRRLGLNISSRYFFPKIAGGDDGYVSDIDMSHFYGRPAMRFGRVLPPNGDGSQVLLLMGLDAEAAITPFLRGGPGLLGSTEAFLMNRDAFILTGLNHPLADGAQAEVLGYRMQTKVAPLAMAGQEGVMETKDYRGRLVLAAFRQIRVSPDVSWILVVKRDQADIFGHIRLELRDSLVIGLLGLLCVLGLAILASKVLTRPLENLSQAARRISEGDLSARATLVGRDEVGRLAATFNSMAERLQGWYLHLENTVNTRTDELRTANQFLRLAVEQRRQTEERYRQIVELANEGILAVDVDNRINFVNGKMAKMLGRDSHLLLGRKLEDFIPGDQQDDLRHRLEIIRGGGVAEHERAWLRGDGSLLWTVINASPLLDDQGVYAGGFAMVTDISQRKQADEALQASLAEKEILLREIHHRVKNNMQVVSSLLRLQAMQVGDEKVLDLLRDSQDRVRAMALAHETLYRSETMAHVDLGEYIRRLAGALFQAYPAAAGRVSLKVDTSGLTVGVDSAAALGLVINELLTNSLKYAFNGLESGEISLRAQAVAEDEMQILVADNGVGLPSYLDWRQTESLGLRLVRDLVEMQLKGSLERLDCQGACFRLRVKTQPRTRT